MNSIYEKLHQLKEEAGSVRNLAANMDVDEATLRYLLKEPDARPTDKIMNKLKPFVSHGKKVQQIKRRYRRKA